MSLQKTYYSVYGRAKSIQNIYASISGKAKKVQNIYYGINNKAKLIYNSALAINYEELNNTSISGRVIALSFGDYAYFITNDTKSGTYGGGHREVYDNSLTKVISDTRGYYGAAGMVLKDYALFAGGYGSCTGISGYLDHTYTYGYWGHPSGISVLDKSLTSVSLSYGSSDLNSTYDFTYAQTIGDIGIFSGINSGSSSPSRYTCINSSLTKVSPGDPYAFSFSGNSHTELKNNQTGKSYGIFAPSGVRDESLTKVESTFNMENVDIGVSINNYAIFVGSGDKAYAVDTSLTVRNISKLSVPRTNISAVSAQNKAIFAGGYIADSDVVSNAVDIYDSSLTRTSTKKLSEAKCVAGAAYVGKHAIFIGGVVDKPKIDTTGGNSQSPGQYHKKTNTVDVFKI